VAFLKQGEQQKLWANAIEFWTGLEMVTAMVLVGALSLHLLFFQELHLWDRIGPLNFLT
jgi:hypothetical protein